MECHFHTDKYMEYLNSAQWRAIAEKRREIDGGRCAMCGTIGAPWNPLQCHHFSYHHLYHEAEDGHIYSDTVTLCKSCHKHVHLMMNRVTSPDGRHGWADTLGNLTEHVLKDE